VDGLAEQHEGEQHKTATGEEIAQIEAWEQQIQDIMNSGEAARLTSYLFAV
jgi:hypothetical protein